MSEQNYAYRYRKGVCLFCYYSKPSFFLKIPSVGPTVFALPTFHFLPEFVNLMKFSDTKLERKS